MTNISVRLPDQLLHKVDTLAHELHLPRAEYVRKALEVMNTEVLKQRRRERLMEVSHRVRKESMKINREFSGIEHDPAV